LGSSVLKADALPGLSHSLYFQAASCALDASAKIYGYRVDALHTDTLKLAGGVGKTANGGDQPGENGEVISRCFSFL
jgi:condensin complex subunit 2